MPKPKLEPKNKQFLSLVETTAWRFRRYGRFVHGFVRGKLLHDPVYGSILQLNILPEQGTIVDLGCGRGILLALLTTVRHLNKQVLTPVAFKGVELRCKDANIAQGALGTDADIINADIRSQDLPDCQAVILLDVLLYLRRQDQEALLQKIARAISVQGILIMREADAKAGLRFWVTLLGERFCALARGHWWQAYCYRSQQEWASLLQQFGFTVVCYPMSEGTPFANVLFVAKRKALASSN